MERRLRNRRWSKRKVYISGVSVYEISGEVDQLRTRNISLEGLLVEPTIRDVESGSVLEIGLPIPSDGEESVHRIPVEVVHSSDKGTGLMFMRYDRELFGLITEITYGNSEEYR